MKILDWCKVFGLYPHALQQFLFFLQTRKQEQFILYFTYRWKKKKKILSQSSDCSVWMLPPTEECTHTNRQEKFTMFIFYWLYPAPCVSSQLLRACLREVVRRAVAGVW